MCVRLCAVLGKINCVGRISSMSQVHTFVVFLSILFRSFLFSVLVHSNRLRVSLCFFLLFCREIRHLFNDTINSFAAIDVVHTHSPFHNLSVFHPKSANGINSTKCIIQAMHRLFAPNVNAKYSCANEMEMDHHPREYYQLICVCAFGRRSRV